MTIGTRGPDELGASIGATARALAGAIRRMIVTRTRTALYQVTGHTLLDGSTETRDAEAFGGVGFASRPAADEDTEAIVAFMGPGNPVIVATRQEAVRRVIARDLAVDETQLHNSVTLIRIKANGTVEIRTAGGTAQQLATLADLQAVRDDLDGHEHIYTPGGGIPTTTSGGPSVTAPTGTTVLKAE